MSYVTENRLLNAAATIARETGFPPTPEELADAVGTTLRSLHSTLTQAKRAGVIRYDNEGRLIAFEVDGRPIRVEDPQAGREKP